MPDLDSCLEIAKSATLLAGNFLKEQQESNLKILANKARDLKLQIDIDAEEIIKEYITTNSSLPILAEESGKSGSLDDYFWVVDPLDGTSNFLHGIPHWAISIALEYKNEIVAGVIYDPIKDEMFTAEKGQGAWLNDRRLRVSDRTNTIEMLFATGVPFGTKKGLKSTLKELEKLMPKCAGIRRQGAAALDLAYVAAGRLDGYWEKGIEAWDMAAGLVIAKEAGALIEGFASPLEDPLTSGSVICANNLIFKNFAEILRE